MDSVINFNSVLIIILGFLATYFVSEVKDGIKGWREAAGKLNLLVQTQQHDKQSVDKEISDLKTELDDIRKEADKLCSRVEELEKKRYHERV